jgi:hypothetical protein
LPTSSRRAMASASLTACLLQNEAASDDQQQG